MIFLSNFFFFIECIADLPRPRRRLISLMHNTCMEQTEIERNLYMQNSSEVVKERLSHVKLQWQLKFLRSPISILGQDKVTGVKLAVNKLEVCIN